MLRKSHSIADTIAEALKADIQTGAIVPGTHLQQEILAKRFSVSRVPVRDALFKLNSEGLVSIEANRGAIVVALSPDQINEIYDLRLLLECDALERAIKAMSPADLPALRRALQRCRLEADGGDWLLADNEFHRAIYSLSGRQKHVDIIDSLRTSIQAYWAQYSNLAKNEPHWLDQHDALYRAIEQRDTRRAVKILRTHLIEASIKLSTVPPKS
ncbi:MAG: GntR family transcriptional regulator [Alphaproteobacteria bacterium]|nr:GntR family transcriptional regulator [Alphaproteobacteria bacterium]